VIVVDDGSSDQTALLALKAGAEVIQLPRNGGKGGALNAGFERARQLEPDAIVMLDADAQHNPAEIPQMVLPILTGRADVVVGSRFLDVRSRIPRWRSLGQRTLTLLTNSVSGFSVTDSQSGFRALAPHAVDALYFRSGGLAVESEMQFLLQRAALRVTEVPISVQYLDGNKRSPVLHGLQVVDAILTLTTHRRPLLFLGLPGLALIGLGFLSGISAVHLISHRDEGSITTTALTSSLVLLAPALGGTAALLHQRERFQARWQEEPQDAAQEGTSGSGTVRS
jgi:glycosyltransferase involved in cell wall biosynthesis